MTRTGSKPCWIPGCVEIIRYDFDADFEDDRVQIRNHLWEHSYYNPKRTLVLDETTVPKPKSVPIPKVEHRPAHTLTFADLGKKIKVERITQRGTAMETTFPEIIGISLYATSVEILVGQPYRKLTFRYSSEVELHSD